MANPNMELTVSVEATVHSVMRKLAQQVWREHKVRILDVNVTWRTVHALASSDVESVVVRTESS
jgi:hypothetical protein